MCYNIYHKNIKFIQLKQIMINNDIPLVKIFCMSYNETYLLEDFILYHGNLFGFENIVIIDNNSTDETVLNIYNHYKPKGVTVFCEKNTNRCYQDIYTTNIMLQYKDKCKFMLPLDTDEFFFVIGKHTDRIDKEDVLDFFRNMDTENIGVYHFRNFYWSFANPSSSDYVNGVHKRPVRNIVNFKQIITDDNFHSIRELPYMKSFFNAKEFISVSHGNHGGVSSIPIAKSVNCGFFHYHNTGIKQNIEKAKLHSERIEFISENDNVQIAYTKLLESNVTWGRVYFYRIYLLKIIIFNLYYNQYLSCIPVDLFENLISVCVDKSFVEIIKYINELSTTDNVSMKPSLLTVGQIDNLINSEITSDGLICLTHVKSFLEGVSSQNGNQI